MTTDPAVDPEAEGSRAGRELWPAGASWVPDEVLARFAELAAQHPSLNTDAARTAFLNAARNARKSAPTVVEARGRADLLERLRQGNEARTAAARAEHDGEPRVAQTDTIARRRRDSLRRRRAPHD